MRATLSDPLLWLYPDSIVPDVPLSVFECDVATGGVVEVNILLNDLDTTKPLAFGALGCPGGEWFRLIDVPVERNTGPVGFAEQDDGPENEFVTRRAPFRVYDGMEPLRKKSMAPSAPTLALRFRFRIDGDAPRQGRIPLWVKQGREKASFGLCYSRYEVVLPENGDERVPYTNWVSFKNIAMRHGLEPWSEKYWRMVGRYAKLMAYGRQNSILFPLSILFTMEEKGPVLNRKRLERLVKSFTEAGIYYLEGGHIAGRTGGLWASPTFSTTIGGVLATSPAGGRIVASIGDQLMEAIEENGWQDRWIQHVADEPIPENASDYRILCGMVRRYMPAIPLMDASQDPAMAGALDIWCPLANQYEGRRADFESARRDCGDEVWYYTCCFPGGNWLNRFLDFELLRPVLLGWGGGLYDLGGFLHWGLNQYPASQDPFKQSCVPNWGGGNSTLPAGDTHIVYPGTNGPWPSLRLEAMRQGMEDFELIRYVRYVLDDEEIKALLKPVIRSFCDYTKDLAVYRASRRRLLEIADKAFQALMALADDQ